MEENELKKDMGWGSFVGIFVIIGFALYAGSLYVLGYQIHFENDVVIYPDIVNQIGIIFSIIVLIIVGALYLYSYRFKR